MMAQLWRLVYVWSEQSDYVAPENGIWGIPHMYAEGVGWA